MLGGRHGGGSGIGGVVEMVVRGDGWVLEVIYISQLVQSKKIVLRLVYPTFMAGLAPILVSPHQ